MRLIDADALRKYFEVPHELKCGIQAGMDEYALKCIDAQPTIPAPRWVRCEAEMPKDGEWVLVWGDGFHVPVEVFREHGAWLDSQFEKFTGVTHWMQLPEPPQEDA